MFWDSATERASLRKALAANGMRRWEIAWVSYAGALRNNLFNEPVPAGIIEGVG